MDGSNGRPILEMLGVHCPHDDAPRQRPVRIEQPQIPVIRVNSQRLLPPALIVRDRTPSAFTQSPPRSPEIVLRSGPVPPLRPRRRQCIPDALISPPTPTEPEVVIHQATRAFVSQARHLPHYRYASSSSGYTDESVVVTPVGTALSHYKSPHTPCTPQHQISSVLTPRSTKLRTNKPLPKEPFPTPPGPTFVPLRDSPETLGPWSQRTKITPRPSIVKQPWVSRSVDYLLLSKGKEPPSTHFSRPAQLTRRKSLLNKLTGREPPVAYDTRATPLEHHPDSIAQTTPNLYSRLNNSALQLVSVRSEPTIKDQDTRDDFERRLDELTQKTTKRKVVDKWKLIKTEMGLKMGDFGAKVDGWKGKR